MNEIGIMGMGSFNINDQVITQIFKWSYSYSSWEKLQELVNMYDLQKREWSNTKYQTLGLKWWWKEFHQITRMIKNGRMKKSPIESLYQAPPSFLDRIKKTSDFCGQETSVLLSYE